MEYDVHEDVNIHDDTFRITDEGKLSWAFRKLSSIKVEENKVKGIATYERERIRIWEERELKPLNDEMEYFNGLIETYHAHVLAQNPDARTISTPYGKSKSRASRAQPEQADKDLVLKHVLTNDMRDFVKEELRWGDFKKTLNISGDSVVDANGEVVPGMAVKPESITFSNEVT